MEINHLENYDLKVGDEVFVLSRKKEGYVYSRGTIKRIISKYWKQEAPQPNERYYKAKLKRYRAWLATDEKDFCTFIVTYKDKAWTCSAGKYVYMLDEEERVKTDTENLNKLLRFKKSQKQDLENYIKKNFEGWEYPYVKGGDTDED